MQQYWKELLPIQEQWDEDLWNEWLDYGQLWHDSYYLDTQLYAEHLSLCESYATCPSSFMAAWDYAEEFERGVFIPLYQWSLAEAGEQFLETGVFAGAVVLSGQMHHVFSNKIMNEIDQHGVLDDQFARNDLLVQALDLESHRGYQKWHRAYDAEVSDWLINNPQATRDEFIDYLVEIY